MTRRPKRATTFVLNGDLPGPECTVLPRHRIQAPTRQAEALATLAKCRRLSSGAVPLCTVFIFKRGHPARSSCEPAAGRASRSLETPVQVQGLPAAEQSTQRDGWGRGQRLPAPGSQEPRPGREEEGGCVGECSRPPPADPRTPVRSAGLTSQGLAHSQWASLCTCTFGRPRRHRVLPSPATGGEAEAQR